MGDWSNHRRFFQIRIVLYAMLRSNKDLYSSEGTFSAKPWITFSRATYHQVVIVGISWTLKVIRLLLRTV